MGCVSAKNQTVTRLEPMSKNPDCAEAMYRELHTPDGDYHGNGADTQTPRSQKLLPQFDGFIQSCEKGAVSEQIAFQQQQQQQQQHEKTFQRELVQRYQEPPARNSSGLDDVQPFGIPVEQPVTETLQATRAPSRLDVHSGWAEPRDAQDGDDADMPQTQEPDSQDFTKAKKGQPIATQGPGEPVPNPNPEPRPPSFLKKDIVPDLSVFRPFDQHAMPTPLGVRFNLPLLVDYLQEGTESTLQVIRSIYRWITHNICFDVQGYYDESFRQPTSPAEVLNVGHTVSDGYANLFAGMCRCVAVPTKVIFGVTKGYDYQVGDVIDINDGRNTHTWNAVYVNDNWFLIDCAWGAGYIDSKGKFIRKFQEFYFMTDPDKFIVDHFPLMSRDYRSSARWQLLTSPVSANLFCKRLKMERAALEWGVKPVSHTQQHIITVENEVMIVLQETGGILEDYHVNFERRSGGKNLDPYMFAYKIDGRTFKVLIRPPWEIDYYVRIYAKKVIDTPGPAEILVTYIIKCVQTHQNLREFITNYRIFGALPYYAEYGFRDDITKAVSYTCNSGELMLPLKMQKDSNARFMVKLEHKYETEDLTHYSLITAKQHGMVIKVRLPFEGYYKLCLLASVTSQGSYRPVVNLIIDCNQASFVRSGFPTAFEPAIENKCILYQPLWKDLPANTETGVVLSSHCLMNVKILFTQLQKDGDLFVGAVTTPPPGRPFTIFGKAGAHGKYEGLYHFTIYDPDKKQKGM